MVEDEDVEKESGDDDLVKREEGKEIFEKESPFDEESNHDTVKFLKVLIVLLVIAIAITGSYALYQKYTNQEEMTLELANCIGNKIQLYTSTTCGYCNKQKDLFGDYIEELNIIECDVTPELCLGVGIELVPTWIIDNEQYQGVQDISELRTLTNC